MITVHHLDNSRSQRILWLLEELGLDYEIIQYKRDPVTRFAPASLKAIHPLGKSPIVTDGDVVVIESGAIIDYILRTYGHGRLAPAAGSPDYNSYVQWMHYAEGSAMLPVLLALYVGRLGEAGLPLQPRIKSEAANHLGYMNAALGKQDYFVGNTFSAADIQLSFVVEAATARGQIDDSLGNLKHFAERIHARPAYVRAVERGGPYQLGR